MTRLIGAALAGSLAFAIAAVVSSVLWLPSHGLAGLLLYALVAFGVGFSIGWAFTPRVIASDDFPGGTVLLAAALTLAYTLLISTLLSMILALLTPSGSPVMAFALGALTIVLGAQMYPLALVLTVAWALTLRRLTREWTR